MLLLLCLCKGGACVGESKSFWYYSMCMAAVNGLRVEVDEEKMFNSFYFTTHTRCWRGRKQRQVVVAILRQQR